MDLFLTDCLCFLGAASNDMPSKVLMYLSNNWVVADANGDGTLSANELEEVYTDQMDVTLTATSRWLRVYCPEEADSCDVRSPAVACDP